MSYNMADQLLRRGETERAEQLLLRLTYLPEPPWMAYTGLQRLYEDTGRRDKALHWAKQYVRAGANARSPGFMAMLAGGYERLGLTGDADYWVAIAIEQTPQPAQNFLYKAIQFQIRGDLAGIRAEIDKLHAALGTDMDGLHPFQAAVYAAANIYVENFDVGIEMLEGLFDVGSFSDSFDFNTFGELGSLHLLAYAYQQVGRDEVAEALLTRLHAHLNAHIVERHLDFGPAHQMLAQNFGLRGDFDAAADALEAAIEAGWLNYIWVMHDPSWAETIADPRIARMLDDVKVELERQRAVVELADAEHDFRAEISALQDDMGE